MGIEHGEVTHLVVDLSKAPEQVTRKVETVVAKTAHDIEADGKRFLVINGAVDTGHLLNSVGSDVHGLSAVIGPTAEYGPVIEYGVPHPYVIRARDGGLLRFEVDGQIVYAREVTHPPVPPRPYMRPAADKNEQPFVDALAQAAGGFL